MDLFEKIARVAHEKFSQTATAVVERTREEFVASRTRDGVTSRAAANKQFNVESTEYLHGTGSIAEMDARRGIKKGPISFEDIFGVSADQAKSTSTPKPRF